MVQLLTAVLREIYGLNADISVSVTITKPTEGRCIYNAKLPFLQVYIILKASVAGQTKLDVWIEV
jgi:hypothetical protein